MHRDRLVRYGGPPKKEGDTRKIAEVDRDRVLYSDELRRLAGVTQVVGASEGNIFHNRLTHSLKVAQLAQRLTEHLRRRNGKLAEKYDLNPHVAEAAGLAHDLGHPPFGHVAEEELDRLASKEVEGGGDPDGFEGNAQSFRIVTRLAAHRPKEYDEHPGLDLTQATLDALFKYPWPRELYDEDSHKHEKFGAYRDDAEMAEWVRGDFFEGCGGGRQAPEAAIMEHADDIAYSVHDLDDFSKAGFIPVARLLHSDHEWESFIDEWLDQDDVSEERIEAHEGKLKRDLDRMYTDEPYVGKFLQRGGLQRSTSYLIQEFVNDVELCEEDDHLVVHVPERTELSLKFLQQLVDQYVIHNASLRTQQRGQREVIGTLFEAYLDAVCGGDTQIIPGRYRYILEQIDETKDHDGNPTRSAVRLAVDIVAGFTDQQAVLMYKRLTGVEPGSVGEYLPVP